MASSGWQSEQTWFTYSSNVRLIGNINVTAITHAGTNLRIQGTIAAGARGNNNYYFTYSDYTSYAQPEGGSKIALGSKGKTWKVGTSDTHVNFDVTLANVPATSTSRSFSVNFYGPNTNSVKATLKWNLSFDASGDAPTGGFINNVSNTWNSVTFTSGVSSWGGLSGNNHSCIVTGSTNKAADTISSPTAVGGYGRYEYNHDNSTDTSWTFTGTQGNASISYDTPIDIKGLLHYKLGYWINNAAGTIQGIEDTLYYLPASPLKVSYTDPGGDGTKVYPIVVTGDVDNNHTTYDTAELKRTVRYKVNNAANWTYVVNNVQTALNTNTTFNVSVPGGQDAVIESWTTYHGVQSEVKTVNVFNGNAPSRVYASIDGKAKRAIKFYVSVNGKSKEIKKLYASVNGKAKAILG